MIVHSNYYKISSNQLEIRNIQGEKNLFLTLLCLRQGRLEFCIHLITLSSSIEKNIYPDVDETGDNSAAIVYRLRNKQLTL